MPDAPPLFFRLFHHRLNTQTQVLHAQRFQLCQIVEMFRFRDRASTLRYRGSGYEPAP